MGFRETNKETAMKPNKADKMDKQIKTADKPIRTIRNRYKQTSVNILVETARKMKAFKEHYSLSQWIVADLGIQYLIQEVKL